MTARQVEQVVQRWSKTPMSADITSMARIVQSVHGRREIPPDPGFQLDMAAELKRTYGAAGLIELYGRFSTG